MSDSELDEDEERLKERRADRYKVWRQKVPLLYDAFVEQRLEWPSMTVDWLPYVTQEGHGWATQKLLLGTQTSGQEPNRLLVCSTTLPNRDLDDIITHATPRTFRTLAVYHHEVRDLARHYSMHISHAWSIIHAQHHLARLNNVSDLTVILPVVLKFVSCGSIAANTDF